MAVLNINPLPVKRCVLYFLGVVAALLLALATGAFTASTPEEYTAQPEPDITILAGKYP